MMPQKNNSEIENMDAWLKHLEVYNVYFSSPLDIDFLMLEKYENFYKNTLEKNEGPEIKIDEYEELYEVIGTTYGQSDSTTFCIPDLTGRTVFGISEDGTLGDYLEAGLPNITGWIKTSNNWTGGWNGSSGVFTNSDTGRSNSAGDGGTGARGMQYNFDASRSSSIYGKSTTVQPPAMVTNFLIKY